MRKHCWPIDKNTAHTLYENESKNNTAVNVVWWFWLILAALLFLNNIGHKSIFELYTSNWDSFNTFDRFDSDDPNDADF